MKQAVLMVRGVSLALALGASAASAQQVMWKDNPITGKVVGLTYGTSGWNAAEAQAVAYGGHLAAIRSQSEQDLLAQQFSTSWSVNFAGTAHGPWFGLNDAAQHSSWVYPSGDPVPYTFWAPGQGPSQPAGTIENYALLAFATENWRWHDAAEYATLRSLIEVSQRPPRSWSWPAVTGSVPQSLYAHSCDLDLDGDIDLVVPALNQVFFYTNNGLGLFSLKQTVPGCGSATKAVAGDFDLDGDLDVAVTDFSDAKRVLLLHQNANGVFLAPTLLSVTPERPHGIAYADLNSDGRNDLLVTYDGQGASIQVRIFPGLAGGGFGAPSTALSGVVASGAAMVTCKDLNGDGRLDALIGGGWGSGSNGNGLRLLRQEPNGTLSIQNSFAFGFCIGAEIADVDSDGDQDIVAAEGQGSYVRIFRNDGGSTFQQLAPLHTGARGYWTQTSDLDGDGNLDVAVACPDLGQVQVWIRDANGNYTKNHVLTSGEYTSWIALIDINGDAKPDVCASNRDAGTISIASNQSIFDCNGNGIEDLTDIASGFALDCNNNKRPDSCDIAFGYSQDANNDGVLDECIPTLVSITPSTRPAALPGTVTLNATNIPAGPATLTLTAPALPTPITLPITLVATTGAYTPTTASVTLPSLFTTLTNGSADDVTCSGTLSWTSAQGSTQTTGSTASIFTFDVPEIVAATPSNAPFDQTTGVVFTLEDHVATSGVGTAKFGNLPPQAATLFSVAGMTKVVTSAPPAPAPGPVSVLLQFGGELTLETRGFVYLGPGVSSQSLTQGWQAGGEALSFGLYDFAPGVPMQVLWKQGASSVSVSGTPSGLLVNASLTVTTPLLPSAGVWDLELVQNAGAPNEKRVLQPGAWLANAPSLLSIAPASAYQGGGETVTLSLAGFTASASARVRLGAAEAFGTIVGNLSASQVSIVAPLSTIAGVVDVQVTQNAGQPDELGITMPGAFTYVGPSIQSVLPNAGPLEGGTLVTVQTSGFEPGQPAQVSLGGFTVSGAVSGSGTAQTVSFQTVLANASGPADLTITQGIFSASLPAAFRFDPARVVNYCTAKLTSQSLLPQISFTGSPSAGVNDFQVTLANALPNKTAQYIYGLNQNNFPLWGGTLCVATSIVRGPVTMTNAGGVASVPFGVPPGLVGSTRYFQYWFRDPQDPAGYGYGLSGGLQVEFYP